MRSQTNHNSSSGFSRNHLKDITILPVRKNKGNAVGRESTATITSMMLIQFYTKRMYMLNVTSAEVLKENS